MKNSPVGRRWCRHLCDCDSLLARGRGLLGPAAARVCLLGLWVAWLLVGLSTPVEAAPVSGCLTTCLSQCREAYSKQRDAKGQPKALTKTPSLCRSTCKSFCRREEERRCRACSAIYIQTLHQCQLLAARYRKGCHRRALQSKQTCRQGCPEKFRPKLSCLKRCTRYWTRKSKRCKRLSNQRTRQYCVRRAQRRMYHCPKICYRRLRRRLGK